MPKRNDKKQFRLRNTRQQGRQTGNENLIELLKPTSDDIKLLLAAQSHIGRRISNTNMQRYIWKRRKDGVHIINLEKTWNKIQLAARIFCAIKNPQDVMVMSARTFGQRGAIKFCHYTKASTQLGKWTPGTLCNPQNKAYREPRLLIVDDPMTCFSALRETSYVGIPVIAFCGVDNNTRFVDCAIPCNNRGRLSIGLMFWLLAREILRMKNEIKRTAKWDASVDLFFYRDPDEIKKDQEKKKREEEENRQGQQLQYDDQDPYAQQYQDYPPQDMQQGMQGQDIQDQQQLQQQQQQYGDYQQQQQQQYSEPAPQNLAGWNDDSGMQDQDQQQQQQQQQYGDYQQQQYDNQQQQYDDQQQQYGDDQQQQYDDQQQQQYDPNQDPNQQQQQDPNQQQGQQPYEMQEW